MLIFPLLWLSLSFIGGIILASLFTLPLGMWIALAGVVLLISIIWSIVIRHRSLPAFWRILPFVIFAFLLGASRYQSVQPKIDPFQIAWYNDRDYDILVTGIISEPPDYRDTYTNLKLQVEKVDTGLPTPLTAEGLLLARVSPGETYHYGERIRLRGKLLTPPENEEFSYLDYLARFGIHSYMPITEVTVLPGTGGNPILERVYAFKEHAIANIYQIFPDPEASLMAGILLGDDSGMPADLQQAYKNTGTAHIIAISGFNIAIIAGVFVFIFSRLFGRRWGSVAAIVGIILYTILVGASASVVRAAIMGSFSIVALQLGRRQAALNTLAFVAAVMAFFNPLLLWDVGYQLSFGATLGLILFAEPLENLSMNLATRYLPTEKARQVVAPIAEFFLLTIAAQITTLPIMAYHFGRISVVSFFANPFVLPAQPPLMLTGALALLTSLIYLPLGKLFAVIAWPFPAYTNRMVEFFNTLPHGVIVLGELSLIWVILYYVLLIMLVFNWDKIKAGYPKYRTYVTPSILIFFLLAAAIITFNSVNAAPDGKLHITFINNGSADVALIQTPDGRYILVDGGESTSQLSDALGRRLPSDRSLDWVIIASTQEEQLAALPRTLERFSPANALWSGKPEGSYSARDLVEWLTIKKIPFTRAEKGYTLDLGNGATLKLVSVTSRGAVMLIEWNGFRALLPIGLNFDALTELNNGKSIGNVSLLSLTDSGYAPSNPPEWIAALHPQLIVLNVKAGDENGNPSPETLKNIKGYPLLRTDQNGWISVATDGNKMWVEAEKK
jgi:competence protein ComEC